MEEVILVQIGQKIRGRRKEMGITVQDLADKVQMSKALISQVERGRTIPSLLVLINIIKALEFNLDIFFKDIDPDSQEAMVLVKRRDQYEPFEKEDTKGFHYRRIISKQFRKPVLVDFVLLELEPGASRPMVETAAYEFKYIVQGTVEYIFEDKSIILERGDSVLFDGRLPHTPKNLGKSRAIMIVIYLFEENM